MSRKLILLKLGLLVMMTIFMKSNSYCQSEGLTPQNTPVIYSNQGSKECQRGFERAKALKEQVDSMNVINLRIETANRIKELQNNKIVKALKKQNTNCLEIVSNSAEQLLLSNEMVEARDKKIIKLERKYKRHKFFDYFKGAGLFAIGTWLGTKLK